MRARKQCVVVENVRVWGVFAGRHPALVSTPVPRAVRRRVMGHEPRGIRRYAARLSFGPSPVALGAKLKCDELRGSARGVHFRFTASTRHIAHR